jgi:hypothetical protein
MEPAYEDEEEYADIHKTTSETTDPYEIYVPEEYGTIIESYKGTNGRLIVHIQDAHTNYESQKNEAGILENLVNDYGMKLIMLEGKLTDMNFNYIRDWAPVEERIKNADELLKNGDINCVNYLNLATDYDINIQGIEDKNLYDKQRNTLWEMDKFKDAALEYIGKITIAITTLKPRIYNEALLAIDKAKNDYDSETIDLVVYYEALNKAAMDKNIQLDSFPNFSNVVKISDMEKKIDLAKINDGTATEEQKTIYKEYKDLLANLNVNKLFKEEPLVEKVIHEALFENADQKTMYNVSRAVSILDKMLRVKVVPEEYSYFSENKKDFDPQAWVDFLKDKSTVLGVTLDMPVNSYAISDNLSKIEMFYSIAFERDRIFLKRAEEHIKNANANISALVAGGFHTPTLTRLLADAGYSYIVVSPRVTTPTDDNLYREALKREWLPEIKEIK